MRGLAKVQRAHRPWQAGESRASLQPTRAGLLITVGAVQDPLTILEIKKKALEVRLEAARHGLLVTGLPIQPLLVGTTLVLCCKSLLFWQLGLARVFIGW
jgi:hypothetical protein